LISLGVNGQPLNGLIARYSCNGGNVIDEVGSNDALTNGAFPAIDRFGNLHSALYFDGTNAVNIGSSNTFEFGLNNFSYSLWFRCDSIQLGMLLAKIAPSAGFVCFIGDSMNLMGAPGSFLNILNLENSTHRGVGIPITMGEWHHLVVVHEYNQANTIYVDNVPVYIDNTPYDGVTGMNSGVSLRFGSHSLGNVYLYTGWMDDIHFYDRTLDATEINALYSVQLPLAITQNEGLSLIPFPNPVVEMLYINGLSEEATYTISSQEGKLIQQGTAKNYMPIDLTMLSPGVYFLSVKNQIFSFIKA
jgi:hypothetical protein